MDKESGVQYSPLSIVLSHRVIYCMIYYLVIQVMVQFTLEVKVQSSGKTKSYFLPYTCFLLNILILL